VKRTTESIKEQLEEAQDNNGYLVRFQDKQMTHIDALKQQIKDLPRKVEALEK
jgi:hypothetical protein